MKRCGFLGALVVVMGGMAAFGAESEWVQPGADGKLVYKTTERGDRVMDFSYAGYMGGGMALPEVAVKKTVAPLGEGKDDTANVQAAVDDVSKLPVVDGFRGAVLLQPGVFTCSGMITISTSGVVLRGSGNGAGGTTIKMVGDRHRAISIGAIRGRNGADRPLNDDAPAPGTEADAKEDAHGETVIADAYVPAGTRAFAVKDAGAFRVGDEIAIRRPTTQAWVHFMGMDTLKRDGRGQTWIGTRRSGVTERRITGIVGNTVTVDIPLADSYDARFLNPPGTMVMKERPSAGLTQVGVEALHIQCPPLEISYGRAPYSAIRVGGDDCWVRDVYCEETMNSTTLQGKRITMEGVVVTHTYPNLGASKPSDFSIEGSQILIDRCAVTGDNEYSVWTTSLDPGPNVVLNSTFRGRGSRIQPHMRWSTGLLVDNCTMPDGGIDFANRGVAGSGHGWTMGWAVAWNCVAKTYVIQNPPGVANWAIGCIGERVQTAQYFDTGPILPEGIVDSPGTPVSTPSLYVAQLRERLGDEALKNIGYAGNETSEFANKNVEPLPPWRGEADPELGVDLAFHRPVNASSVRNGPEDGERKEFGGERAVDGDAKTYWATTDNDRRMTLELDMEGPVEINALALEEALGTRVQAYKVEGQVNSDWKVLSQGTGIGERKVDRFAPTTVWKVRLTILKSDRFAAIRTFELYRENAPATQGAK